MELIATCALSLLIRPSGIYALTTLFILCIALVTRRRWICTSFLSFWLILLTSFFVSYYSPYISSNQVNSAQLTNESSLWGTPTSSKYQRGSSMYLINSLATLPLKYLELSGVRPTYNTVRHVNGKSDKLTAGSSKPYFYTYGRITWGLLVILPATMLFIFDFVLQPNFPKLLLGVSIIIVPISLTQSLVQERYFLHTSIILACLYFPLVHRYFAKV